MLTVEHLTYRYSRRSAPVLRGVDLTLESGEIGILLGCNGSGKTTLFKNLLGICTPDAGSVRFDGQELTALSRRRRAKQPLEYPSAGSTFKRPAGHFAGGLIEQCGLKGTTVGGAQVSEKNAGFVINTGQATCQDILTLIRLVRDRVFQQTGVRLEPEVRLLGCTLEEP